MAQNATGKHRNLVLATRTHGKKEEETKQHVRRKKNPRKSYDYPSEEGKTVKIQRLEKNTQMQWDISP